MIHETIGHLAVPVSQLVPYERNPRRGNLTALRESLRFHGQYRPIVVNKPDSRVLAGNHTLTAAKELGWSELAVTYVDVDADTAARIVAVDNRANDLAGMDDEVLAELLSGVDDLAGTGYTDKDLAKLLGAEPDDESGADGSYTSRFELVIECGDEAEQHELYDRLSGEGWSCRVLSL